MLKAREAYTVWHKNAFGTEEGLLPLPDNKIKAFSADMAKAGYASHTIILYVYIYLSGLCTWVSEVVYSELKRVGGRVILSR